MYWTSPGTVTNLGGAEIKFSRSQVLRQLHRYEKKNNTVTTNRGRPNETKCRFCWLVTG